MNTHEQQTLFHTTNLKVATALVTLGFEKVTTSVIVRQSDGKDSMVFWFQSANPEGVKAETVFHGMTKGGDALSASDPDHIVNYLRCFAANRDFLIAEIKSTPRKIEVRSGDKSALISENASDATKRQVSKLL